MQLILIRHAIARPRSTQRWRDDAMRPLSVTGQRRFRRAVPGLHGLAGMPQRLYASPLLRSRQTAQLLSEVAHWPAPQVTAALSPGAPAQHVMELLTPWRAGRIALVGHEPELSRLLALLIAGQADRACAEFKKGAAACVQFAGKAGVAQGTLRWLLPPRALRAMASGIGPDHAPD